MIEIILTQLENTSVIPTLIGRFISMSIIKRGSLKASKTFDLIMLLIILNDLTQMQLF